MAARIAGYFRGVPRAVVLLSGGLDSATVLAHALAQGIEAHALTVSYGQRHAVEIEAARRIAQSLSAASHKIVGVDLREIGGSALTSDEIAVPKEGVGPEIPVTYVPARNTLFLSLALGYAEAIGAREIWIGANAVDYSGYPDCRPEFIAAFETLANLATKAGVEGDRFSVRAPLMHLTKPEIIRLGQSLGLDYALTTSCYDPGPQGRPCGVCDSCRIRQRGFAALGLEDPALTAHG